MSALKCIFLGEDTDESPVASEYSHYFLDYFPGKWGGGGADGVFSYEDKGVAVAALVVMDNGDGGISVRYDFSPGRLAFYSVADSEAMDVIIDVGDDQLAPAGSFLSPVAAWQAVEDFLKNPLERSPRIRWMNADDIKWPED